MELNETKRYVLNRFSERHIDISHLPSGHELLHTSAIRYQYFGERMLNLYESNWYNCCYRSHPWFLLEMVNPDIACHTTFQTDALKDILDIRDTNLWSSAYGYYDHVGHEQFGQILRPWLDEHRDILIGPNYDMV